MCGMLYCNDMTWYISSNMHLCSKAVKSNQATPMLQCHGEDDMLVAHSFGSMTSQLISTFNNQLQFKSYPGLGHSSCEEV